MAVAVRGKRDTTVTSPCEARRRSTTCCICAFDGTLPPSPRRRPHHLRRNPAGRRRRPAFHRESIEGVLDRTYGNLPAGDIQDLAHASKDPDASIRAPDGHIAGMKSAITKHMGRCGWITEVRVHNRYRPDGQQARPPRRHHSLCLLASGSARSAASGLNQCSSSSFSTSERRMSTHSVAP